MRVVRKFERIIVTLLYALGSGILGNFVSGNSSADSNDTTNNYDYIGRKGQLMQNKDQHEYAKSPGRGKVTRWVLFSPNPRPVSFFRNPRFEHFSSGRHVISYLGLGFSGLYPANTEPEIVSGEIGLPQPIAVPFLLAMLVPETSPHFAVLRKEASQHTVTYPDLWRATRHPSTIMLVVGDEYCLNGLFAREFSKWSSPTLRTYWSDRRAFVVDSEGREGTINNMTNNAKSSRRAESVYVPLGPRKEFNPVGDAERNEWPATKRPRLFNLLVSLSTNALRAKTARVSEEIYANAVAKTASMSSLSHRDNDSTTSASESTIGVGKGQDTISSEPWLPGAETALLHNAKFWQPKLPDCNVNHETNDNADGCSSSGSAHHGELNNFTHVYQGQNLPAEAYRQALLESVFTICPPGHSPETFRLFEAVEAGSIPIVDGVPGVSWYEAWGSTLSSNNRGSEGPSTRETKQRRLKAHAVTGPVTATGQCVDPMRPFRESGAPFIWISDWEAELGPLLTKLREAPLEVLAQQKALAAWYQGFMKNHTAQVENAFDTHLALGANYVTKERPPARREPYLPLKNFM